VARIAERTAGPMAERTAGQTAAWRAI